MKRGKNGKKTPAAELRNIKIYGTVQYVNSKEEFVASQVPRTHTHTYEEKEQFE